MAIQGKKQWAMLGGMVLALALPGVAIAGDDPSGTAQDSTTAPDYHSKTTTKTTEQTEETSTQNRAKDEPGTGGSGLNNTDTGTSTSDMALPSAKDINGTGGAGNVDNNDGSTKAPGSTAIPEQR